MSSSASLYIGKTIKSKVLKNTSPASNHTDKSSRPMLTVCVRAHESNGNQDTQKSPCRNDLCDYESLVTSCASSFVLSAWWRSCQVLSKEAFSKEIWTSLALSFCEDICQQFRDGREREQIIPQQGITVVPLNYLKLNKQQEARPEAEERLMDMTVSFFPKSSASVFLNSLRLWIPGNCILEQIKK